MIEKLTQDIARLRESVERTELYLQDYPGGHPEKEYLREKAALAEMELRLLRCQVMEERANKFFKPVVWIDQSDGTIEVVLKDCSVTEEQLADSPVTILRHSSSKKIVGVRVDFQPKHGFILQVTE